MRRVATSAVSSFAQKERVRREAALMPFKVLMAVDEFDDEDAPNEMEDIMLSAFREALAGSTIYAKARGKHANPTGDEDFEILVDSLMDIATAYVAGVKKRDDNTY